LSVKLQREEGLDAPPHTGLPFDPSGIDVLDFAAREIAAGRPACIATVVQIFGTSPRARGAQMAVALDGRSAGHVSSGCLERAIVAEAQAAMRAGESRLVRYGQGSQYIDIALPCGSALQILFSVAPSRAALSRALESARARRPFALSFDLASGALAADRGAAPGLSETHFVRAWAPRLRVIAAGQGAELTAMTRIVLSAGYDMCAVSPDDAALAACASAGAETVRLKSAGGTPDLAIDPWTAVVLLFHEREWEVPILKRALASPAFYVGAVGSRRTAAARLEDLFAAGVSPDEAARLRGPIGMLASTRDPSALALSALTEIVSAWRAD
jgi:xanthine dehydrogenase accessory factor